VLVAVDARRGRLFVQMFGTSALDPLTEALELTAAEVVTLAVGHEILIAGSGAQAVANAAAGSGAALEIVPGTLEPHAGDLARLAPSLVPRLDISPLYLRAPDAKPQSGKRLARTR
jgi:tRNA A37 threonylcarbamoyladenosine modification protein TsaB